MSKTGSQVIRASVLVAVNINLSADSRLLPSGFAEYHGAVLQEGEECSPESHDLISLNPRIHSP